MATYSSTAVVVSVDDSGGSPQTFTSYVRSIGNISIEAIIQESTVFGASWATYVSTGIKKMAALTLGGFYDDTATTSPYILFSGFGTAARTVVITIGGGKTVTFEALVQKFERLPKLGAMTEYTVTLQPTGTVTEN